jgi:hypothetical protein
VARLKIPKSSARKARTPASTDHGAAGEAQPEDKMPPDILQRRRVAVLSYTGFTHQQIAELEGMSYDKLYRRFKQELEHASATIHFDIINNIVNIARDPNHKSAVDAAKFILSRRDEKFKEVKPQVSVEVRPLEQRKVIEASRMSPEMRDQMRELMLEAMRDARAIEHEKEPAGGS